jgi:large subunit ribosomal protein L27
MAHVKAQKTAAGNRDSVGRRLGVKIYGDQLAKVGNIIIRQRGTKFNAGAGTKLGRDFTIYAARDGRVEFIKREGKQYVMVAEES